MIQLTFNYGDFMSKTDARKTIEAIKVADIAMNIHGDKAKAIGWLERDIAREEARHLEETKKKMGSPPPKTSQHLDTGKGYRLHQSEASLA